MESTLDVRLVDHGKVKALVDLTYGDFVIRGFKVLDPGDGKPLYVAMPSKALPSVDGETRWRSVAYIRDAGRRKAFECYVIGAYRRAVREAEREAVRS